jgi:hypothetical protein
MNGLDDDPFGSVLESSSESILGAYMKFAEEKYFKGTPPVVDLEMIDGPDPAILSPERKIQISKNVIRATKMCKVLILHELIHHHLLQKDHDADKDEGPRFQAEVQRLWDAGAYKNLL